MLHWLFHGLVTQKIHFILINEEQFEYTTHLCRYQAELPVNGPKVIHGKIISTNDPASVI